MYCINTVLCPIKVENNTIELIMHTSCYCGLDLLCVIKSDLQKRLKMIVKLNFSLLSCIKKKF